MDLGNVPSGMPGYLPVTLHAYGCFVFGAQGQACFISWICQLVHLSLTPAPNWTAQFFWTYLFILIARILCTVSVSSFPFDSNCSEQLDAFWTEIDLAIFYQGAKQRASAEMCSGAAGEISIIAWHWKDQL